MVLTGNIQEFKTNRIANIIPKFFTPLKILEFATTDTFLEIERNPSFSFSMGVVSEG